MQLRGTEALQLLSLAVIGDAVKMPQMILRLNCPLGEGPGAFISYLYRTLDPCVVCP